MKVYCGIFVSILFLLCACQNSKRPSFSKVHSSSTVTAGWGNQVGGGAYQVSAEEYKDNFESRYGLLHLKSENVPFTGRVLMVDIGESGEFVSSDESWVDGRKDGKCSKWFSNGVKMYERNYSRGKWHGTVTRWWPNGQKMYVRAYSYGVRHGKEATWRSDGTPITLPKGVISNAQIKSSSNQDWDANIDTSSEQSQVEDSDLPSNLELVDSLPSGDPGFSEINDNSNDAGFGSLGDSDDGLDTLPEMETDEDSNSLSLDPSPLPPLTVGTPQSELPQTNGEETLLDLPSKDMPVENDLPPLPPVSDTESGLPPFPVEDSSEGLPPLPGGNPSEELPPLPGNTDDSGFDDLPPLPPLP